MGKWQSLGQTRAHTHIQPTLCPSLLHSFPPFSFSGCLSLSPITLPVLVFDLQTLVGIMTTNQGWRWVITMWPTHPSWPFYSPHMMHLPDSFWEPAELHREGFIWSSQGAEYSWMQCSRFPKWFVSPLAAGKQLTTGLCKNVSNFSTWVLVLQFLSLCYRYLLTFLQRKKIWKHDSSTKN